MVQKVKMSWDVILIKTGKNNEPIENITEANTVKFSHDETASILKNSLPGIECVDETWLNYETPQFAVSFNLACENNIMLHIYILDEPEDAVLALIKYLYNCFDCRAFDTTSAEFI